MASNSPPAASLSAPRGRAKACTSCRQVKLRCDAREVYPAPCTRCRTQRLDCRMDPSFKRVPARKQLEEVSNRLINLQKSLGIDQNSDFSHAGLDSAGLGRAGQPDVPLEHKEEDPEHWRSVGISSNASSPQDQSCYDQIKFLELAEEPREGSWTLGDVTLSYEQVLSLFHHFDMTLFGHLPILEPCHSIHSLYKKSELLFWSIVLVSSRLYNAYDNVYLRLVSDHRTLLSSRMMVERVSLQTIHAILLICTWPYPVSKQYDDFTWILCGIAINLAMTLGLHKPNHTHEYGDDSQNMPGSATIRKITWLACFQISTSVGSWLGMPPSISSSAHIETIDLLCRDSSLPKSFRARAEIQRQMAHITTALDSKIDFRTRYSLIKMYEQDLIRMHSDFADAWSDELEIEWLAAKLYLYGMAFVSGGVSSPRLGNQSRAFSAREILQYGLAAGSRLLNTVASIKLPHTALGVNKTLCSDFVYQLAFFPKQFFRIAAFANFFLLWYLAVDVQSSEEDKQLARTYVGFTYRLLYSFKHSPEHLRAAKSIEMMARIRTSDNGPRASHLLVNSRLGASFMYSLNYNERADLKVEDALVDLPILGLETSGNLGSASVNTNSLLSNTNVTEASEGEHMLTKSSEVDQTYLQSINENDLLQESSDITELPQAQHWEGQMSGAEAWQQRLHQQGTNQPQYSPSNMLANAFFQDTTNQNFDFLWQGWDPTVFDELKMEIDSNETQMPMDSTEFLSQ